MRQSDQQWPPASPVAWRSRAAAASLAHQTFGPAPWSSQNQTHNDGPTRLHGPQPTTTKQASEASASRPTIRTNPSQPKRKPRRLAARRHAFPANQNLPALDLPGAAASRSSSLSLIYPPPASPSPARSGTEPHTQHKALEPTSSPLVTSNFPPWAGVSTQFLQPLFVVHFSSLDLEMIDRACSRLFVLTMDCALRA